MITTESLPQKSWVSQLFRYLLLPLSACLLLIGLHFASGLPFVKKYLTIHQIDIINNILLAVFLIVFYRIIIKLNAFIIYQFKKIAVEKELIITESILELLNNSLKMVYLILLVNISLPYFSISEKYTFLAQKSTSVLLIVMVTWMVLKIADIMEKIANRKYQLTKTKEWDSKRILTQFTLIKRISIVIIIVLATFTILALFDRAKELGMTLLASAGIIAAIGSFAAQNTLSNMFAGIQIAISQCIKIDDSVFVENEFGTVEDINLTYVIIKLWDLRRIVIPISYFVQKPFQNWTYHSRDLSGIVTLHVDFSLPLDETRSKYFEFLNASSQWDKRVGALQVADINPSTMELRLTMSAANSSQLWDLRCDIREKMIKFIRSNFPDGLPKTRYAQQ